MKEDYSILLLGNIYGEHTIRFVRNLKNENPKVQIDCFGIREDKKLPVEFLSCIREFRVVDFSKKFWAIPVLRNIELIYNWRTHFHQFANGRHYDIAQIHYPEYTISYILRDLRAIADNLIVTPWGSDVYRISKRKRDIVRQLYKEADYVTGAGDRFTKDFMQIFRVPQEKFAHADLGSETIDYIADHKDLMTTEEAKHILGVDGYYTIGCGYNASAGQQHLKIIESIDMVKEKLPGKLMLLFPVTYPQNPSYLDSLKQAVEERDLNAKWFERYLDLRSLFVLQMATDMFIHVQTTDANSTSLKEYILCGKNCINGGWLKYDDIEEEGMKPYHVVENLESLGDVIVDAYHQGIPKVTDYVIQHIESLGCKPAAKCWNNLFMNISSISTLNGIKRKDSK